MKLIEKLDQFRRDFDGLFVCEGCNTETTKVACYDDDYFHDNVIPAMKCPACDKSTNDLGLPNVRMATKYAPHEIV